VIFLVSNEEEKDSIEKSLKSLEDQLQATNEEAYSLTMKRKFLNHRIADLKYELRQKDDI
jgi:chromosome segregation ATPase